jgi:hypothetical protein
MLTSMRDRGAAVVDIDQESEDRYAAHCRAVDLQTASLRDCLSYYNSDGNAEPGSLGYYGGPQWHAIYKEAAESLAPFRFEATAPV